MELNSCYCTKVNSKAFAIPFLTESDFIMIHTITVRIGIENASDCYIAAVQFHLQQLFSILFDP